MLLPLLKLIFNVTMLHSSDFPINQNQFTAAVTEECMSVNADFDPSLDDDLEADLYQECQSCSLITGGFQQSKRQGLMIINQCNHKCIQYIYGMYFSHFHCIIPCHTCRWKCHSDVELSNGFNHTLY